LRKYNLCKNISIQYPIRGHSASKEKEILTFPPAFLPFPSPVFSL
jgi:hypothetical protein